MIPLHFVRRTGTILVALFFAISSFPAKAQNRGNMNAILYNGNAFYWTDNKTDTITETDAETGEMVLKIIAWEAAFIRMNEETIYNNRTFKETTEPEFEYNHLDAQQYLQQLFRTQPKYQEIPAFSIRKMVINKQGKPIFFEIQFDDVANNRALREKWSYLIENAVKTMPRWKPGKYKEIPVLFFLDGSIHVGN